MSLRKKRIELQTVHLEALVIAPIMTLGTTASSTMNVIAVIVRTMMIMVGGRDLP